MLSSVLNSEHAIYVEILRLFINIIRCYNLKLAHLTRLFNILGYKKLHVLRLSNP